MRETISQLEKIIVDYTPMLKDVDEEKFSNKPNPKKWSKSEILGHVIDSAQNNIRRFIVAQYEDAPLVEYDQDQWVSISNYQARSSRDLIELWVLLNRHICGILENMSTAAGNRTCQTDHGKVSSISHLAKDYVAHLKHHLHQILELEPIEY